VAAQAAVRIGWMLVRQGSGGKCQEADLWKYWLSFPPVPKQLPTLTN